jgi:hypothetical protein
MTLEIELRPGVVFRTDAAGAGSIEFPKGRRFDNVSFLVTLPGTTENGRRAHVNVLSAVFPTSPDEITSSEHLPALAVVPAETQYLKGDREILWSLFLLESMVEGGGDLDPGRTVVLTLHGSAEVFEGDQIRAGNPTLPSVKPDRWISLDPPSVAALVRRVRSSDGQLPNAVVNTGCFSSTRCGRKKGTTFNEELAGLLADEGIAVYGPPYAGIVTSATWLGQWRAFGQRLEDDRTIREVPIKFQRIAPAPRRRRREAQVGRHATTLHGSLVITNDVALAGEVCSFSPDFAQPRPHDFDRSLME